MGAIESLFVTRALSNTSLERNAQLGKESDIPRVTDAAAFSSYLFLSSLELNDTQSL